MGSVDGVVDLLLHIVSLGTIEICIGALLLFKPERFVRPRTVFDEPELWLWRPPPADPTLRHARDAARVAGLFLILGGLFDFLCS